jgi:DNA invertase Pin-like site-specific DNA recombinase
MAGQDALVAASENARPVKAKGVRLGYTRVSTVAQTLEQQNAALAAAGVTKTFSDTMSGARDDRPGLAALLDYVREGDTVVVWKLDRLGRNMLHILQTVKDFADRGVTLISTSDGIDSSTAAGRMMIGVLGALAEYERELVRERTELKRQLSLANGVKFGRPRKVVDPAHLVTAKQMKTDGHTVRDIAKYLGVSRATLYRYLAAKAA